MNKITGWLSHLSGLRTPRNLRKKNKVADLAYGTQLLPKKSENESLKNAQVSVLSNSLSNKELSKYQNASTAVQTLINSQADLSSTYQELETAFREIEFTDTDAAWVQRADLLDALDLIVAANDSFKPLTPSAPPQKSNPIGENRRKGEVFLVPYQNVKDRKDGVYQGPLESEHTKTAAMVQRWTERENRMGKVYSLFYRVVTKMLGVHYYKQATTAQIAQFSRGMGISSSEIVTKKDKDGNYFDAYRGPKYLFGQSVHEFKTVNDWFVRDLTESGRADFLSLVKRKEDKLKSSDLTTGSLVVSANSNSRVRTQQILPGHFGDSQVITGKVLNAQEAEVAKEKGDNPSYYEEKYQFSTKNLLGRESDDPMRVGSEPVPTAMSKELESLRQKIGKLPVSSKKRENLQARYDQLMGRAGRHELLGSVWRYFNEQGATQVIQRLAPADIHHYVAPLKGTPMSQAEAAEYFREKLEARGNNSDKAEIEQLKKLKALFDAEQNQQATIDISGTNASVSTPAVRNQARILAQNDRKVMLFKHPDGAVSLHVFIGATGVNRVDVKQQTGKEVDRGADQGLMAFGDEKRDDKTIELGEWQGGFPINGSTVISYYLPTDFHVLPKIESASKELTDPDNPLEGLEIKTKMGMPLLVKTEVLYAQALKRAFTPERLQSWDQLVELIKIGDFSREKLKKYDLQLLEELKDLLKVETPTQEQQALMARLKELVQA